MDYAQLKDKVPPNNLEAEQATLGALLLDPEAISNVIQYLQAEDFYNNANKNIFSAIINLSTKGQKVDLITLSDELRTEGLLEKSGNTEYIAKLTDNVPSSANVEYYAKIVQECSIRRTLLGLSSGISKKAHDSSIDTSLLLDELQESIFEISHNTQTVTWLELKPLVQNTIDLIEKMTQSDGELTGIPSGYGNLDTMTNGFQNSELIIIGARPSIGKTALALNIASFVACNKRIPVCFFSLEMSAQSLMLRILTSEARIDAERLKKGLAKRTDVKAIYEAASKVYESPLYIIASPNLKLLELRSLARRLKSEKDIKLIMIDYLTLITYENQLLPRHEQISNISRSLKSLARELDVPVVVLSQVKRESEGKAPNLADIRESGSIEQDADVIMFLHRDREQDRTQDSGDTMIPTDLIVAKNRNGPVGTAKLAFHTKYTRFVEQEYEQ